VIRLQKALADRGVASRRRAEELITGGRVRVDGEPVTTLGTKVKPDARIDVDGVPTAVMRPRYVLLNKPRGIVSTAHDERGRKTVVDLIGASERLYPVGRLDTDSEGMLLLTNDGEWAQRVLHPRYGHEREYDVAVSGELSPAALAQLHNGIRLEEGLAIASRIDVRSRSRRESHLRIVLHTGWRRQIRRMLSAVGLRTVRLMRVRIGPLTMGKIHPGDWRELTPREIADLARPVERAPIVRPKRDPGAPPAPTPRRGARPATAARLSAAPRRVPPRRASAPSAAVGRSRGGQWPRVASSEERGRAEKAPRAAVGRRTQPATAMRRGGVRRAPQRTPRRLVPRRPRYGATRGPVRARVSPR
jgi:23S rRNA pseudouridine2605 synthase